VEPGNRRPKLNFRVDPAFRERVGVAAERDFQGNEAMLMRDALETYLDLRDGLGLQFHMVIEPLRRRTREAKAA
jgi:hypothetical protein